MLTQTGPSPRSKISEPKKFPVLFVGHGSPMNAIENNEFSNDWKALGRILPMPKAVLCISAHWETRGTRATAMEKPRTIHDFGGFPEELYQVQYPAPGSPWLAEETKKALADTYVDYDEERGLDHGTWSVLKNIYPEADVPVVQLSLDYGKNPADHYALGKELAVLRKKDVLIIGSGNMVHNLGRVVIRGDDFNEPFGFDWALEANGLFKKLIDEERHEKLMDYKELGKSVRLAVPTPEHFLPMLYVLALQEKGERVRYFNDKPLAGSLTMTSFVIE
jgi:4,5-DOPA dioxygenase extradiol